MVQTTPKIRSFTSRKTVFFPPKSKIKIRLLNKTFLFLYLLLFFLVFKTTPDFVIIFKTVSSKDTLDHQLPYFLSNRGGAT